METDAIVLDCNDHGESDVIVTLFSLEVGRITAIAKGAKKSLRRFVNKLELFSFLHVVCTRKAGKSLSFLAEADLHTSFLNIRKDLELYAVASVIREFLLVGIREDEPDERIFHLSLWSLHKLDLLQQPRAILALFLIRFFEYVGYRPDLETCGKCAIQVIPQKKYSFDPSRGRIICSGCVNSSTEGISLSHGTIKILRSAQDLPLERLHRLKISGTILQEALTILHSYGRHLFQRDIISWKIMKVCGKG
ncbi:MAG: DNA repair protein RecO [Proteobacteria bacterium]|nr:DNA repair protein RecO [Pseudomonadota bacterium]